MTAPAALAQAVVSDAHAQAARIINGAIAKMADVQRVCDDIAALVREAAEREAQAIVERAERDAAALRGERERELDGLKTSIAAMIEQHARLTAELAELSAQRVRLATAG